MYGRKVKLRILFLIVLFSSNATKSEEVFGGMGCEIMNLKMLSMLDGEIKYSEQYGDMTS